MHPNPGPPSHTCVGVGGLKRSGRRREPLRAPALAARIAAWIGAVGMGGTRHGDGENRQAGKGGKIANLLIDLLSQVRPGFGHLGGEKANGPIGDNSPEADTACDL